MTPIREIRTKTRVAVAVAVAVPVVLIVAPCFWHLRQYALFLPRSQSGEAALKSGDYDRAIRDLEFVDNYSPNLPRIRYMLGLAYIKSAEERAIGRRAREELAEITASLSRETKTDRGVKRGPVTTGGAAPHAGEANP